MLSSTSRALALLIVCLTCCLLASTALITPTHALSRAASTPTPIGTVMVDYLNVRSGPSLIYRLLGQLHKGDRVPVLKIEGEWIMIYYNGGPNGYGWVNGLYLTGSGIRLTAPSTPVTSTLPSSMTGEIPATADATAPLAITPQPINFDGVTFTWQWLGQNEIGARDWYFDLQLFQANQADPYDVLVVEPGQLVAEKGVYRLISSLELPCNTTWAVQIAVREQGQFSHWASSRSEKMPLGSSCATVE